MAYVPKTVQTFQVFPDGIDAEGYYMKSVPRHFPDWIGRTTVAKRGGSLVQVVARDTATLVYLAGQNMVTPHAWLSRADKPREPDRLILDFDPSPGAGFAAVRAAARAAGEHLRDAGLVPFAMVTGSRGIHVVCPLRRGNIFRFSLPGRLRRVLQRAAIREGQLPRQIADLVHCIEVGGCLLVALSARQESDARHCAGYAFLQHLDGFLSDFFY